MRPCALELPSSPLRNRGIRHRPQVSSVTGFGPVHSRTYKCLRRRPLLCREASRALGKRESCRARGCHGPSILTWKALSHPLPSPVPPGSGPSLSLPGASPPSLCPEASPPAPVATHQPPPTPGAQMGPNVASYMLAVGQAQVGAQGPPPSGAKQAQSEASQPGSKTARPS